MIRGWIASVLNNFIHYKAEHQHTLNEAATTLELILPTDLLMTKVLPFLKLPSHVFEEEEEDEDEGELNEDYFARQNQSLGQKMKNDSDNEEKQQRFFGANDNLI